MKPNVRFKATNHELHEAMPFVESYNPPLDVMARVGLWCVIAATFGFWYIVGTIILGN